MRFNLTPQQHLSIMTRKIEIGGIYLPPSQFRVYDPKTFERGEIQTVGVGNSELFHVLDIKDNFAIVNFYDRPIRSNFAVELKTMQLRSGMTILLRYLFIGTFYAIKNWWNEKKNRY